MTDIATLYADLNQGVYVDLGDGCDYALDAVGFVEDDGLLTAVILSLFTDRVANSGDVIPDGSHDVRGWWGDSFPVVAGDLIGSRLWLLRRSKQLSPVLLNAQDYATESLQWLVDDGVAQSVTAVATNPRMGILALQISITRANQPVVQYRFSTFWGSQS